ncbi:unnamed protein product [Rotaria sp. Silwood1]|nr:unnamed protein product [Rotaria sp. Silwood1]
MYQICQSLTVSLVHPEDVSTLNDQFSLVNEYFQQLNEQNKPPHELIQLDNDNMIPRFSWYKRDLPTPNDGVCETPNSIEKIHIFNLLEPVNDVDLVSPINNSKPPAAAPLFVTTKKFYAS